jgi:4'-phosphopantetheinyl transferase
MEKGLANTDAFQLRTGQVDIWLLRLSEAISDELLGFLKLLSQPERTRWQGFAAIDAQLQYLATRALVRTTLSRCAKVPAQTWQFEENLYGRPHIVYPTQFREVQFNASNTTGLVGCAISIDCEIGIDIENIARAIDPEEVAPSVFSSEELADFRAAKPEDKLHRFFAYWTLKESYIKARGMGLSLPLDSFWFELGSASPHLYATERCADTTGRWRFYQYAPTDEHMMAVAVSAPQGVEPLINLRWTTPMLMKAWLS